MLEVRNAGRISPSALKFGYQETMCLVTRNDLRWVKMESGVMGPVWCETVSDSRRLDREDVGKSVER